RRLEPGGSGAQLVDGAGLDQVGGVQHHVALVPGEIAVLRRPRDGIDRTAAQARVDVVREPGGERVGALAHVPVQAAAFEVGAAWAPSSTASCARATRSSQARSLRFSRSGWASNSARGTRLTSAARPAPATRTTGAEGAMAPSSSRGTRAAASTTP